eukprot:GHVR01115476.1.p3 GENE.GHVR01115476.1~~GHVR01115476.1.p3  ORF type:complete len:201 (+),score=14.34 GHVR01115476.1:2208-2810(+)
MYDKIELMFIQVPNLVKIRTIGDGSCLFHSILAGTNTLYNNSSLSGKQKIAVQLRSHLARKLDMNYDKLSRGELKSISEALEGIGGIGNSVSLPLMKTQLDSHAFAGQEYLELVSNELNIDVYILDINRQDVYMLGDTELLIRNRPSILIGYDERMSHYDLIGQELQDRIVSLFSSEHETVIKIRERIAKKKLSPNSKWQ